MTIKTSSVRWARWLLRVAVTCEALLAVGQAILMGGFLQGHYPLLAAHQVNATFTGISAMPMTAAAVLQWRPRRWATPGQGQVVDRQMWSPRVLGLAGGWGLAVLVRRSTRSSILFQRAARACSYAR